MINYCTWQLSSSINNRILTIQTRKIYLTYLLFKLNTIGTDTLIDDNRHNIQIFGRGDLQSVANLQAYSFAYGFTICRHTVTLCIFNFYVVLRYSNTSCFYDLLISN